jgi:hypothetical protein
MLNRDPARDGQGAAIANAGNPTGDAGAMLNQRRFADDIAEDRGGRPRTRHGAAADSDGGILAGAHQERRSPQSTPPRDPACLTAYRPATWNLSQRTYRRSPRWLLHLREFACTSSRTFDTQCPRGPEH